jgi:hypothetical protein
MGSQWKPVIERAEQAARLLTRAADRLPVGELDERERKALSRAISQASQGLGVLKRRTAGQAKARSS